MEPATLAQPAQDFDVSIIVALPESQDLGEACILALAEHTSGPTFEVVLVVDAAMASSPLLATLGGDVQLVRDEATGPAARWARGAEVARGRYLVLLDGHLLATPGWLGALVAVAEAQANVAAVGPRTVGLDGSERPLGVGFASEHGVARAFAELPGRAASPLTRRTLPALGAGCLLVRRADFASVLGLDPRLRGLGALLDLALRLHARGRLVAYQPQAGLVTQRNEAEPLSASDAVLLRRQWGVAAATSPDALWVDGRSPGPTAAPLAGAAGHFRDDPARRPPAHVDIGRHSFFGSGARFLTYTAEERIRIGKYCSFAADVTIFTGGGHSTDTVSTFPFENVLFGATNPTRSSRSTRDTVIGNDAWVGDRAVIAGGVHVGDGAVVGTAAVVLADVPPCAVVAGNPATVLRYRFSKGTVAALLRIAWWEWGDEELRDRLEWFFRPVGDFVRRFDVAGQGEESG